MTAAATPREPTRRVRRSRCLVAFWERGALGVQNYLCGTSVTVAAPVVDVLDLLEEYEEVGAIAARLDIPAIEALLETLITHGLLVVEGSATADREELLESVWPWGHDARFFHFATNDLEFVTDPREQLDYLLRRSEQAPPPSPYKEYAGAGIELPRRRDQRKGELWSVLQDRRTCRAFTGAPISRDDLADILLWTWGQTRFLRYPRTGDFLVKTSPSGGARHPIEVYPVVLAVDGIEPGIYHYSVRQNQLVALPGGHRIDLVDLVVELCAGHEWIRDAAAVCFMTAVIERSSWKYTHSHAYRVLHLDAGHLGQTFHLVCTQLGLGPFTFAATCNPAVERVLGIDGIAEIVLYAAAVGVPTTDVANPRQASEKTRPG